MNENNNYSNVTPYKANGNLNNIIENPSMNVNDTMNVNIQNTEINQPQNYQNQVSPNIAEGQQSTNANMSNNVAASSTTSSIINNNYQSDFQNKNFVNVNNNVTYTNAMQSTNNQPKKKNNKSLSLGPEFKTAFLIIIILLVFVFVFL